MEIIRRRWAEDAVLESPFVKCSGFRQVSHQWFALVRVSSYLIHNYECFAQAKMVSTSERVYTRILSATNNPNRLIYSQKQLYTLRLFSMHRVLTSCSPFCLMNLFAL